MVVVLIIGILVAIAIPVFNAAKAKAQERSCFANQRTLEGSAQTYAAEFGVLPTTVATMVPEYVKADPICPMTRLGYHITSGTIDGDSGAGAAGWTTVDGRTHTHY
jgi:type II secretory pathway pseudopilin PulG